MSDPDPILMPPSSEFVALCQYQIALLTQVLGSVWSAVYLTEGLEEGREAKLIPVAVHPQKQKGWQEPAPAPELAKVWDRTDLPSRLLSPAGEGKESIAQIDSLTSEWEGGPSGRRNQIVLPLIYQDVVMGLLVTGRGDRAWNQDELTQIEKIAKTLAIARLLDRRQGWYQQQLSEQQESRRSERDRLDDFLHQLRNPLTALRTFSKLLLKRLLPGDRNQSVAKSLLRESDRLQELVQQFEEEIEGIETAPSALTLTADLSLPERSSVSTGSFLLPSHSLNLQSLAVKDVLEPLSVSARAIAQERGIHLKSEIPSHLPPVRANAKALREVLNNLIDNALKYTPAGGQVEIQAGLEQASPTGGWQGTAVRDSGVGIPVEDRERIFERHYRGIQAGGNIPGSGLGLAIAKELADRMQGKIEVISPNESGSGTTSIVWLPLA